MAESALDTIAAELEARGWTVDRDIPRPPDALGRWRLDAHGGGVCYLEYFGSSDNPTMVSACADPDSASTQMAAMLHLGEGWKEKLETFLKGVDRFRAG
jgi:hypothetical protein